MGDLQARLVDVFGALDEHDPRRDVAQPIWCVSDRATHRSGSRTDGESSDEDELEHKECIEILHETQRIDGDVDPPGTLLPSASACRAFRDEAEEDIFDQMASESLGRLACKTTPKPALKTQVADDNLYDRMTDRRPPALETPASPATQAREQLLMAYPGRLKGSPKKVRFRETDEEVLPALASPRARQRIAGKSDTDGSLSPWDSSPKVSQILERVGAAEKAALELPLAITKETVKSMGLSYVPEHVRRPQAFTCYSLDEPLVVGSGGGGRVDVIDGAAPTAGDTQAHGPCGTSELDDGGEDALRSLPGQVEFVVKPSRQERHPTMVSSDTRDGQGAASRCGPVSVEPDDEMKTVDDVDQLTQGKAVHPIHNAPKGVRVRRRYRGRHAAEDDGQGGAGAELLGVLQQGRDASEKASRGTMGSVITLGAEDMTD